MALEPEKREPWQIDASVAAGWFEDYEEVSQDARDTAEQCRDYYDNIQWTEEELSELQARNQPPVTKNRIKPKVDQMLGLQISERTDPLALPRNVEDIEGAQAATKAIRYVCDRNKFDVDSSLVFGNITIEGTGGLEGSAEEKKDGDFDLALDHHPWDRLWHDYHDRRPDFKFGKYRGTIMWMDRDDAKADYPDHAEDIETMFDDVVVADTFDDKPSNRWVDSSRDRVRIARVWYVIGGEWYQGDFSGSMWLEEPILSPWVERDGTTLPGLILRSVFITRENDRYGVVWPLLSIQDAINHRESKALHLTNVRQTYGNKDSGVDTEDIKKQMSKADGHVEIPAGSKYGEKFGILPTADMAEWQWRLLQEGKDEIDNIGAAAALSGKGGASSGREFIARQQGGKMELGPVFDAHAQWNLMVYEWIWGRIQQFWTKPKMIRITDDPKAAKFVELNKPITRRDVIMEQIEAAEAPEEAQRLEGALQLLEQRRDPRLDEQVGTKNNMAETDVDLIVDSSPDVTTLVGEQFEKLMAYATAIPGSIPPEILLKASDLPDKEKLIDELEDKKEQGVEQSQQQAQLQQQQIELAVNKAVAEIQNTEADTAKKQSETAENIAGIQQGSQPTEGADPLDQAARLADLENTSADTEKKQSEAFKNMTAGKENIAETVGIELDNRFQPVDTLAGVFDF